MTQSTQSPERYFSAICTNGVFRTRTRATVGTLKTDGLRSLLSRVSAHIHHRTVMPLPGSVLRTAFERTPQLVARAVRSTSLGEGPRRLICNLLSLVHAFEQALCGLSKRFKVAEA